MTDIGSYHVLKKIGEGGFGTVYQAEHKILNELSCLKQNSIATKDNADLLIKEAKLLWKLEDHHSIPTVKDLYRVDKDTCVMAMSYIDGKTLEDTIKGHSGLHPEDACWITERLLGALYYCHNNGVIHTDIKPANIFIEPRRHDIKLIDFGLASYMPKSVTTPIGYTPRFAAPELIDGKPPIPETDIYGAGLILLYALGGDIENKSFPKNIPDELTEFCNSLLKYDPMERPNWKRDNPYEKLSDIRQNIFGRRHIM